ncbi:unnamed protein product [Oncorhynchus mykiss]|uniref:Doublecortin domain-containing protein n=1 Tax=Oncorhynchus mykiss TaxID=8022 RepID=A0A060VPN9_ONCMY|nr:unnamed protein product [Oncorhynchus mykiss]
MSDVVLTKCAQDQFSGSGHTVTTSRHPYITDPIASKRICFYKSGDPQFSGLHMVINNRTFKTFDALLDSLSKKVPLPFGVRNITTPRGVHAVHTLDELEDGKAYICSDQRKVKPINMAVANKKLPPWYNARPMSARHRALQLAKQNPGRPMHINTPVIVRTPKRLMVFQNGDPSVKHNLMLQKRTTHTFEALLDYLSELMHFPVVKLHTPDGRRVDGLPALIICSGIVVAAGREAFKSGNYKTQKSSASTWLPARRMASKRLKQPASRKKKPISSGKSKLFSPSSERYFVNQINHCIAGSECDLPSNNAESVELEAGHFLESVAETDGDSYHGDRGEGAVNCMPGDDDIEKSFRVNQDGSMTVEMKVRLTIREEETIHWTTTLSRSSVANQLSAAESELENSSPESNILPPTQPNTMGTINGYNVKKDDHDDKDDMPPETSRLTSVEVDNEDDATTHVGVVSPRRAPTPGPRRYRQKQASVESLKTMLGDEIQENMVGSNSYRETTENGEVKEEYRMVRQCSSKPVPKPRGVGSVDINNYNKTQSTFKSGMAEILQIQNGGEEVIESVMHIYEQQTCQDNFLANSQHNVQGVSIYGMMYGRTATSDTAHLSSSNDLELELGRPSTASKSISVWRADQSLSSEFTIPKFKAGGSLLRNRVLNVHKSPLSMPTKDNDTPEWVSEASKENSTTGVKKVKKMFSKPKVKKNQVRKVTTPDKRRKESNENAPGNNKRVKTGGFSSNVSIRKMYGPKPARSLIKNKKKLKGKEIKLNIENPKESAVKELHVTENRNNTSVSVKKNVLHVTFPTEAQVEGTLKRQRSMHEERRIDKDSHDLSSSNINEYVENWLEKALPTVYPDPVEETQNVETTTMSPVETEGDIVPDVSESNCEMDTEEDVPSLFKEITQITSSLSLETTAFPNRTFENIATQTNLALENTTLPCPSDQSSQKTPLHSDTTQERLPINPSIPSPTDKLPPQPDMKPVLEKLCFSIQSIRQITHNNRPSCLEKSNSLPDFSSHVASTFGSSTKALLSFLSVITLKESFTNWNIPELNANSVSCTEALKMMESLREIANMEGAEELKASLSELQKSTSTQLLQSWKGFQELNSKVRSRSSTPNSSEHNVLFETCPEKDYIIEEKSLDIDELIHELDLPGKLMEALAALPTGVSESMEGDEIEMSKEANEKVESFPEERVNAKSTAVPKEEASNDNVLNIDANVDVKSIVKRFINIYHPKEVTENKMSPIPESQSGRQEQPFSSEEQNFKEDFTCHRSRQAANKEGSELEQDNWEGEAKCSDKQIDHDKEQTYSDIEQAYSLALHDGYLELQACPLETKVKDGDIQSSYVEEEESLEEEQEYYIENALVEQENKCMELQVSCKESLEKDQASSEEEQECHVEDQLSYMVSENRCMENECLEEEQQCHIEDQPSYVGLQVSYEERVCSLKEQATSEEEYECHIEDQPNHEEPEVKCLALQDSSEDGKSTPEEDQAISDEELEHHVENQPNHEDTEIKCMDAKVSSEESMSNLEEQQASSEEELECHIENQPSHEEKGVKCMKMQVSREKIEFTPEEDKASLGEEEESHEDDLSYANAHINVQDEQTHLWVEQTTQKETECTVRETLSRLFKQHSIADRMDKDSGKNSAQHVSFEQQTDTAEEANFEDNQCSSEEKRVSYEEKLSGSDVEHVSVEDEPYPEEEYQETLEEEPSEEDKHYEKTEAKTTNSPRSLLAFSYDGCITREPDGNRVKSIKELFIAKSVVDNLYGQTRLPSPNTSDLSDNRPETSGSGGHQSQTSTETSSGEDDSVKKSITKCVVRRTIERLYGKKDTNVKDRARESLPPSPLKPKSRKCPGKISLSPFHNAQTKGMSDLSYFNATSSVGTYSDPTRYIAFNAQVEPGDCFLIDKDRWLLRESVIRKSVSEPIDINKNTSASTEDVCKNTEEDVPYSLFGHTDLEDIVKSVKPLVQKCTYFNLPHGCDSDPHQDDLSPVSKGSAKGDVSKDSKDKTEKPKLWAEKNGIAFAPTDFKMPDNKVHPLIEGPGGGKPGKGQTDVMKISQEPDALEMLYFSCGQHCPIL